VGPRVALDVPEKSKSLAPTENRTPECPALSLPYPGTHEVNIKVKTMQISLPSKMFCVIAPSSCLTNILGIYFRSQFLMKISLSDAASFTERYITPTVTINASLCALIRSTNATTPVLLYWPNCYLIYSIQNYNSV
jgi:hypothetical protein